MRTLLSLALIGLFTSFSAQETLTYPYNPDGDVDGAIASPDLLDLLGVYGGDFSPSEIQIDGVGLLQVIQDLQNQIGALQGEILDANYVESTFSALQTGVDALQAENVTLNNQVNSQQDNLNLLESTVSSLQEEVAQQQQLIESLESAMNQSDPQIIDYKVFADFWDISDDDEWGPGEHLQYQIRFFMSDDEQQGGWQPLGGVGMTGNTWDSNNPPMCYQTLVKYSE